MSNNIYNILGKLASLTPKQEEAAKPAQTVYESVEAQGSILEGVAKVEKRLSEQFAKMKEERETLKTKSGTIYKGGKYGTEYQGDASDEEAAEKAPKKRGRPAKGTAKKVVNKNEPGVRGRPKKDKPASFDAPKGDIFGRTSGKVPAGKKGTVVKGKANQDTVDEGVMSDLDADKKDKQYKGTQAYHAKKKADQKKTDKVNESRDPMASEYTDELVAKRLSAEKPGMDTNSNAFADAVYDELIAIGMTPRAARYKINIDEDFMADTAAGYDHFCKSVAEAVRPEDVPAFQRKEQGKDFPVTMGQVKDTSDKISHRDTLAQNTGRTPTQDLDELAKLAGLTMESKKADKDYDKDGEVESGKDEYLGSRIAAAKKAGKLAEGEMCSECDCDPCECDKDEELEEGKKFDPEQFGSDGAGAGAGDIKKEGAKPDFLDVDKDGNKKEPFKKAAKEKVEECDMSPLSGTASAMDQDNLTVNTSYNSKDGKQSITITADGEQAVQLAQLLKLSGMAHGATQPQQVQVAMVAPEQEVDEEREIDQVEAPHEQYATVDSITQQGNDLNRPKQQDPATANRAANPLTVKESEIDPIEAMGRKLMQAYESIKVQK